MHERPSRLPRALTLAAMREASNSDHLHGRLFFHDGTAVFKEFKVEVEITRNGDTQFYGATSDHEGRFSIEIPGGIRLKGLRVPIYVQGERVNPRRIFITPEARVLIVMSDVYGGSKGDAGGLITGEAHYEDGAPAAGVKVEAKVISTSMLGFLSPNLAETRTDKRGRFALDFDGGTEIKNLMVNGNPPLRSARKTKGGEEVEIDAQQIKAGTFNLRLTCDKKFLGIW